MEDVYNVPFIKDLELTIYLDVGSAWRMLEGRHYLDILLKESPKLQNLLNGEDLFATATLVNRIGGGSGNSGLASIRLALRVEICHLYQDARNCDTTASLKGQIIDAFMDAVEAYNERLFSSYSQKTADGSWEPTWKMFRNIVVSQLIKKLYIFDGDRLVIKKVSLPD